jgi:hypothetical protein
MGMRYKEHTVRKLEAQATKLRTLQKMINMTSITGADAIAFLAQIIKELDEITARLMLERDE